MSKYEVLDPSGNGKVITVLNEQLAKNQMVTDEQLSALRLSHQVKHLIFKKAKGTKDERKLSLLAELFDELEYLQQELWNFPRDARFHRFFELPNCQCPKIDNYDALGTDQHIIVLSCPAHGKRKYIRSAATVGDSGIDDRHSCY